MKGVTERRKRYVCVSVRMDEEGHMRPLTVYMGEEHYDIDEVIGVQRMAARRVGGAGVRYTVRIGEKTTYLFYEDPKWFVEEKVYE